MAFDPHEEFMILLACVMEHNCTPFQGQRFVELMRLHPEFVALYRRELQMDVLLRWSLDSAAFTRPCVPFSCRPRIRHSHLRRAGIAALLLLGCGLFAAPFMTRHLFTPPPVLSGTTEVTASDTALTNEENATMKIPFGTASRALAAAVLTSTFTASGSIFVDAEVGVPHWNRVFTQSVQLTWDWNWEWVPSRATQVTLQLAGVNSSLQQTFQKPVTNYTWTVYPQLATFKEDSYRATLTFLDAESVPLANVTARLDSLNGTFVGADIKTVSTNELAWKKVRGRVLIPYDCGWAESTAQARTASLMWKYAGSVTSSTNQTASAVGMCPWVTAGWPKGEYRLDLAFDGSATPAWTAYVQIIPDGLLIVIH